MLHDLSAIKSTGFSGAGLVLYQDATQLSQFHCDLVNDDKNLLRLKIGTKSMLTYLSKITNYQHPYHDGFHFINGEGILTHVAQFFSPPVIKMPNLLDQGARTFCAQCGSKIPGVLMIGSVSSHRNVYLFQEGNFVNPSILHQAA